MTYPEPSARYHKVIFWLIMAIVFAWLARSATSAEPTLVPSPPPWCVQIDVTDKYGSSHGSGVLVSPSLVLTNNHVVCDRKNDESVKVWFPSGETVGGVVIRTDKVNDLAAIRVPSSLKPFISLRSENLQIGEQLTFHGYAGKHKYRCTTGVLTRFESPRRIGLNTFLYAKGASSRDGDSGGPITREDGTLGGVLFGPSTGVRLKKVREFINLIEKPLHLRDL